MSAAISCLPNRAGLHLEVSKSDVTSLFTRSSRGAVEKHEETGILGESATRPNKKIQRLCARGRRIGHRFVRRLDFDRKLEPDYSVFFKTFFLPVKIGSNIGSKSCWRTPFICI